ncbi:hypothetical protein ACLSU7_00830 [Bdellovibrio sp. HCB185ZH]|uniref:hypothetical protein n=1 Tax=Bdellovibrio sp. HCB185ZH TaxID=3394235 RepID=UPI0039A6CC28
MKTYSKFLVSAMIGLMSVSAHAFNPETASLTSAEIVLVRPDCDSCEVGGNGIALGNSVYDEAPAEIRLVSHDDQMNSREVTVPVLIRMKTNGLLLRIHSGSALALHGLNGKSLESVLGTYRGGTIGVGALANLGARAFFHTGKPGIFIVDIQSLFFGFGVELSFNKVMIVPRNEAANVSVSVSDQGSNQTTEQILTLPDALKIQL